MKEILMKGARELKTTCKEIVEDCIVHRLEVVHELEERFKTIEGKCVGYGLAANQLGIIERAAILSPTALIEDAYVMLNPEILRHGKDIVYGNEGCLSQPGVIKEIGRYRVLDIQYRNKDWKLITRTVKSLEARIIQHELDHLNGLDCLENRL